MSPPKSQQCGQSATHDGMFPYSPAMLFAAMVIRNNYLRILPNISDDGALDAHSNAANVCQLHIKRLRYSKIGTKILRMFNLLSQHIACDFEASQPLLNAPSQVCSIASCGTGLYQVFSYSPAMFIAAMVIRII